MTKVVITRDARHDIMDIIDYTRSHFGNSQAKKLKNVLASAIESLREQPLKGGLVPELAEFGNTEYRQLIKKPFRLIYLVQNQKQKNITVAILLCADGRRNMSTLLKQRLFRI